MRLVFVLYAEDRDLLSSDEVYQKYYAVTGLFERLREDAGRHTDTMDHRYGAWAQLLTLFRLVHDGGRHGEMKLPGPEGLSVRPRPLPVPGRAAEGLEAAAGRTDRPAARLRRRRLPRAPQPAHPRRRAAELPDARRRADRLGLRDDDGLQPRGRPGPSIAIKPKKAHGAPTTINLDELLAQKPAERAKWLKQKTDQEFTGQAATALKEAETPEDAVAALEKKVAEGGHARASCRPGRWCSSRATSAASPGSHYTPRSLTEPIVRTTLRPILERLGRIADAGADPRPQGLRPGDGLGGVPGRGLPPARRTSWSRPGTPTIACPRSRRMRTSCSTPGGSSPSAASTGSTGTRWRSTWPSSRSGSRRWPRTTPSRSSTMPCDTAIRWWV